MPIGKASQHAYSRQKPGQRAVFHLGPEFSHEVVCKWFRHCKVGRGGIAPGGGLRQQKTDGLHLDEGCNDFGIKGHYAFGATSATDHDQEVSRIESDNKIIKARLRHLYPKDDKREPRATVGGPND
jgi:hypothetical protein